MRECRDGEQKPFPRKNASLFVWLNFQPQKSPNFVSRRRPPPTAAAAGRGFYPLLSSPPSLPSGHHPLIRTPGRVQAGWRQTSRCMGHSVRPWIRLEISLSSDQKKENAEEGHKFYCNNTPGPRLGQTIRTDGSAGGGAAWAAGKKATQI